MARAPVLQEIDAVPEADRFETYPHPRQTADVVGHASVEAEFAEAAASGRLHHGWLLAGREGIGKATLAWRMARYLLARPEERGLGRSPLDIDPAARTARQVNAVAHSGLLLIRRPWDPKAKRFTSVIPVDEVRRIRSFLTHTAGDGAWRVVIVDAADELNISSANALLKSLEEPPPRLVFLLVASEPGRLLATIRSRCRRLSMAALGAEDLRAAVIAARAAAGLPAFDEKQWTSLIAGAQGSVRRMLALLEQSGAGTYGRTIGILSLMPKIDWNAVHALADDVVGRGAEARYEQLFAQLQEIVARLVRIRAVGGGSEEDNRLAARIIPDGGLATWAELWETIGAKKAETDALNLDRKGLILEIFAQMQAASRG